MPKVMHTESSVERLKKRCAETSRKAAALEKAAKAKAAADKRREEQERLEEVRLAAEEERRQKELDAQAVALQAELRAANANIGKYTDPESLDHPALFYAGGRAGIQKCVDDEDRRMAILECHEDLKGVREITQDVEGQLCAGWIVPDELDDPYKHVTYLLWDHYCPQPCGGYESDDCGPVGCVYVGVNALGKVVDWGTTLNWVKLTEKHKGLGYIQLHSS